MVPEDVTGLKLPVFVSSPTDVARLRREMNTLDEALRQESLRHSQQPSQPAAVSRLLDELASANNLDLAQSTARQQLIDFLVELQAHAPVVQVSFAVDPSPEFVQKIVQWFRQHINPSVLVRVGLQPNIAAGCVVRTTNKYYDCSLREHLRRSRAALAQALETPHAASSS